MRDVLEDIDRWRREGESIALATVIQTWGSAPRGVGAKMALTASGKIAGSVSGGCVEGAVTEAGHQVLRSGKPQLLRFGVTNEMAWEVGLACGGTIEIFVQRLDLDWFDTLHPFLLEDRPVASVTVVKGPDDLPGRQLLIGEDGTRSGTLTEGIDAAATEAALETLAEGQPKRLALDIAGQTAATETVELFIEPLLPPPTLIVIGGVHIAIALTSIARTLGYRTILVDPRSPFATSERFPHVDRIIQAWPQEALAEVGLTRSTAVAMLTHDPKLDDPALKIALPSPAFYVGALGSRKTHEKRRKRLLAEGVPEPQLARLHAPIGLDIDAQTPEEIALAIMAEIVAARNRAQAQRTR